jgi:hypothetical protein
MRLVRMVRASGRLREERPFGGGLRVTGNESVVDKSGPWLAEGRGKRDPSAAASG